jgi:predicted nucleic acid-binding protein
VRVVIADTGPLNYLLLIDQIELLPRLFEKVHVPDAVRAELADDAAPQIVRDWIAKLPSWLCVEPTPATTAALPRLDAGEQAAIALAIHLKAELLLIDDRAGVKAALAQGLAVVGTLGILDQAASAGLIELRAVLKRLTGTNFRVRPDLLDTLLAQHRDK